MKTIFVAFLLLVSLVIQAQTTWYIDPAGSDATGNGTTGNPWKSLYKACASVKTSGDVIHVNAGTFVENSRCELGVGVSIVGEGLTSIIKSNYAAGENDGTIRLNSATANPTNGNQSISNIKLDGNRWTGTGAIAVNYRYNVSIHHCTIVDFDVNAVTYFNNNSSWPKGPSVTYATGNSIHDCIIHDCEIKVEGQDGFLLYNCTSDRTGRVPTLYDKCLSSDWMKGFKIYNNTFSKHDSSPSWNFFFETWHYSNESEIFNNTFNGSASVDLSDIRKGSGRWGLKVYNNQFLVAATTANGITDTQAIDIEGWGACQYIYIYNNYFKNCVSGIWLEGYNQHYVVPINGKFTMDHIYIYYNIFNNIGCTNKAWVYTISLTDGSATGYPNNVVWDNIFICNNVLKSADGPNQNKYGIHFGNDGVSTNFHIDNNIIQAYNSYAINFGAGANINTISIEQNLFFQNGINGVRYTSTPLNKTETTPTPSNALFVSSTDFHLQATSPAINNGVNLNLPVSFTDYDGNPVGNPPEIGAYEFIGSDNHSPIILDQSFQMNEKSPDDTVVGTVVAADPDAGQTLTYSIVSGNIDGAFTIDTLTGVLSVASGEFLIHDFSLVVKVLDDGIGELSSQALVVIHIIPTGTELTQNIGTIKVYPNPASDEFIIEMEGNMGKTDFEILNSIGKIVFKGFLTVKTVVQTSGFTPGIYFIKIENHNTFEFKKIVKV